MAGTRMETLTRGGRRSAAGFAFCEELESRTLLAAHTIGDFFPLVPGDTWTYGGTYNGNAATAVATAFAGPVLSGTPTTKIATVINSDSVNYTDTRFYGNAGTGISLFRQDLADPTLLYRLAYSGGILLLPTIVNDGQVIHFSRTLTGSSVADSAHGSWTGTIVGDATVIGLEEITTSVGSFEALRVSITGTITENGSTGWTATGTLTESRWMARNVGTVHVDYAAAVTYSDDTHFAARFNLGLTGSSRLGATVQLQVTGRGAVIAFGDSSPTTADGTNFAGVDFNGGQKTRAFRITNTSTSIVSLSAVTLTGVNAGDFVVIRQPQQTVNPGASTVFTVRFFPGALGARFATVNVSTVGGGQAYTFDIRGTGILIGRINVSGGNNVAITNGQTVTNLQTGTKFGNVTADGTNTVSRTFTIFNSGVGNLVLTGASRVIISGPEASDFTVSVLPSASIAPGASSTFTILFDPSALGNRTATVSIQTNDRFTPLFTFTIRGTGI